MRHPDDFAYFSSRAIEELERGDLATHTAAAAAHYELAHHYDILAAGSGSDIPTLEIIDGGKVEQHRNGTSLVHPRMVG